MTTTVSTPRPALILSALGVLPFAALTLQIVTGWPMGARNTGPALYALQIYGAVIVSFLGGIHWGLAAASARAGDGWRRYGASVLPALGAWGAVFGLPAGRSLVGLAAVLVCFHLYERSIALGEMPEWLLRVRTILTTVVTLLLGIAATLGPFS